MREESLAGLLVPCLLLGVAMACIGAAISTRRDVKRSHQPATMVEMIVSMLKVHPFHSRVTW